MSETYLGGREISKKKKNMLIDAAPALPHCTTNRRRRKKGELVE